MEPKSTGQLLSETKDNLEDIKGLQVKILEALEVLEQKQKEQKSAKSTLETTKSEGDVDHDNTKTAATDTGRRKQRDLVGVEIKPVPIDEPAGEQSPIAKSSSDTKASSAEKTSVKSDKGAKPKGILKPADKGTKLSYGFKERLDLDEKHVVYGSVLKRRKVELHQDNRLCEKFEIHPNIGHVYENDRFTLGHKQNETRERVSKSSTGTKQKQTHVQDNRLQSTNKADGEHIKARMGVNKSRQTSTSKQPAQGKTSAGNKTLPTSKNQPIRTDVTKTPPTKSDVTNDQTEMEGVIVVQKQGEEPKTGVLTMEQLQQTIGALQPLKEAMGKALTDSPGEILGNLKAVGFTPGVQRSMLKKALKTQGHLIGDEIVDAAIDAITDSNGDWDPEKMKDAMDLEKIGALVQEQIDKQDNDDDDESTPSSPEPIQLPTSSRPAIEAPPSPEVEEEDQEDAAPVSIDPALWVQYANEEIDKGRVARDVREVGMDTVFCLDLSSSMKGEPWNQATEFINNFVDCIQNTTLLDNEYEHIALVTFGSETRVQQHLTCDYVEIKRKLERLKPSGPSPLLAGIHMAHAAIVGAGMLFKANGYKVPPRVFLITDGKATPGGLIAGPDALYENTLKHEKSDLFGLVKNLHSKYYGVRVFPVPVGNPDMSLLEEIASCTKGSIVLPGDWKIQSSVFRNYKAAAQVGHLAKTPELAQMVLGSMSDADQAQCQEFLRTHSRDEDSDSDSENEDMPALGSRIQTYIPGATIMSQVNGTLGTVTKHMGDGNIGVTWDKPDSSGSIRAKVRYSESHKDIVLSDSPRVLHDELIGTGCRVRRGPDWQYSDQDGGAGNLGSVYQVAQNGRIKVRWDCGYKDNYRFGMDGKFEVELYHHPSSKGEAEVKKSEAANTSPLDIIEEMNKRNQQNLIENAKNKQNSQTTVSDTDTSVGARKAESQSGTSVGKTLSIEDLNRMNDTNSGREPKRSTRMNDPNRQPRKSRNSAQSDPNRQSRVKESSMGQGDPNRQPRGKESSMGQSDPNRQPRVKDSSMGQGDPNRQPRVKESSMGQGDPNRQPRVKESSMGQGDPNRQPRVKESSMGQGDPNRQLRVKESSMGQGDPNRQPRVKESSMSQSDSNRQPRVKESSMGQGDPNRQPRVKESAMGQGDPNKQPRVKESSMGQTEPRRTVENASVQNMNERNTPQNTPQRGPKTGQPSLTDNTSSAEWMWLESDTDIWHSFPDDINMHIENSFQGNSKGTTLIQMDGKQFRIAFSRMESIEISTRKRSRLERKSH